MAIGFGFTSPTIFLLMLNRAKYRCLVIDHATKIEDIFNFLSIKDDRYNILMFHGLGSMKLSFQDSLQGVLSKVIIVCFDNPEDLDNNGITVVDNTRSSRVTGVWNIKKELSSKDMHVFLESENSLGINNVKNPLVFVDVLMSEELEPKVDMDIKLKKSLKEEEVIMSAKTPKNKNIIQEMLKESFEDIPQIPQEIKKKGISGRKKDVNNILPVQEGEFKKRTLEILASMPLVGEVRNNFLDVFISYMAGTINKRKFLGWKRRFIDAAPFKEKEILEAEKWMDTVCVPLWESYIAVYYGETPENAAKKYRSSLEDLNFMLEHKPVHKIKAFEYVPYWVNDLKNPIKPQKEEKIEVEEFILDENEEDEGENEEFIPEIPIEDEVEDEEVIENENKLEDIAKNEMSDDGWSDIYEEDDKSDE